MSNAIVPRPRRRFVLVRRERLPRAWLNDVIPASYAWTLTQRVVFALVLITLPLEAGAWLYFAASLF